MGTILVQFDGDDILFLNWDGNEKSLVGKVEAALGTKATGRRHLVFVVRTNFVVEHETVPLFLDEDGSAHIELRKNSPPVKSLVIERIRRSWDFKET